MFMLLFIPFLFAFASTHATEMPLTSSLQLLYQPTNQPRFLIVKHPETREISLITCACCLEKIATFSYFLAQFIFLVSDPLKLNSFCAAILQLFTSHAGSAPLLQLLPLPRD